MENENDSLARTAHVFGMTDLEFEARSQVEAELAAQQVIRQRIEDNESAPMPEVPRPHEEQSFDPYQDYDYGYHDQYDF